MRNIEKRLPRLKKIETQSAARLQEVENKYRSLLNTHRQLTSYRSEYHAANAGIPALIMDAQCFIERLDRTIAQVEENLQQQERIVSAEQNRWLSDRARVKAVENLCDRISVEVRNESQNSERRVAESLLVYRKLKMARKQRG